MTVSPCKWLISAQSTSNPTFHLICFPFGGGGASVYRDWGKLMPANVQLWAVQYPGRENRFGEPFASDYRSVIDGVKNDIAALSLDNVVLFGHSMGAHFATLLAQESDFSCRGLIVSGIKPYHIKKQKLWASTSDQELKDHVINLGAIPDAVKADQGFLEMYMEKIRADYRLYESVPIETPEPITIPILAIRGDEDPLFSKEEFEQWAAYTSQPIQFEVFAGGHFYFQPFHKPLLRMISEQLRKL